MVDEIPFPTKEERRQRKKQLQCARRRTRNKTTAEAPIPANAAVSDTAPTADAPPAKRRGRPKRPDVTAADVTGLNCFEKLRPLLERLHDVGCERDKAGNRDLHCDEFCLLMLLGLFTPVVDSLRGLQQASGLEKVQQRLKLGRASLGSLSEASRVFDAALLQPIIKELGGQLQPLGRDPRLANVPHTLTLVDGTLLSALPLLVQQFPTLPGSARLTGWTNGTS